MLLFSGTEGRAGVRVTEAMTGSITAPVDNDAPGGAHTGIAVANLEEQATSLTLDLLDTDGSYAACLSPGLKAFENSQKAVLGTSEEMAHK